MMKTKKPMPGWTREPAETTFVWRFGDAYPTQVICTLYETNAFGEKRLVESKTFNLVEINENQKTKTLKRR